MVMEPKYYAEEVIGHPLLISWEYDWMHRVDSLLLGALNISCWFIEVKEIKYFESLLVIAWNVILFPRENKLFMFHVVFLGGIFGG